jgi:hypothetical protein
VQAALAPSTPSAPSAASAPSAPSAASAASAASKPPATATRPHWHGRALRHLSHSRRRHSSHITITPAPNILFTLPRFLSEPLRMPAAPRSPSPALSLSDNQHALYRGH